MVILRTEFSSFFHLAATGQQQQAATNVTTTGKNHPSLSTRFTRTAGSIIVGNTAATRKQW
jgi:hypothetical protein